MKHVTGKERAQGWVVDYSEARARAIRWLGDRYLLAKPINARASGSLVEVYDPVPAADSTEGLDR
jgi:hypothetical protein